MRLILSLILFLSSFQLLAEYRVYQYYVKAKNPFTMDPNAYLVTDTLDPTTYIAYHGGPESIKVDLVRTWMCYANTSIGPVCPPPLESVGAVVEN